ncbi:hypothetical protein JCM10207_007813 [Rhodosporidiobolus poonsookiae]
MNTLSTRPCPQLGADEIHRIVDHLVSSYRASTKNAETIQATWFAMRREGQRLSLVAKSWLAPGRRLVFHNLQLRNLATLGMLPPHLGAFVRVLVPELCSSNEHVLAAARVGFCKVPALTTLVFSAQLTTLERIVETIANDAGAAALYAQLTEFPRLSSLQVLQLDTAASASPTAAPSAVPPTLVRLSTLELFMDHRSSSVQSTLHLNPLASFDPSTLVTLTLSVPAVVPSLPHWLSAASSLRTLNLSYPFLHELASFAALLSSLSAFSTLHYLSLFLPLTRPSDPSPSPPLDFHLTFLEHLPPTLEHIHVQLDYNAHLLVGGALRRLLSERKGGALRSFGYEAEKETVRVEWVEQEGSGEWEEALMAPKKKGGKKQPQDDDAFWEAKAGSNKATPLGSDAENDDDFGPSAPSSKKGGKAKRGGGGGGAFGGFAGMMVEGDDAEEEDDDEPAPAPSKPAPAAVESDDEEGGLMAMARKAKDKKGKKKGKKAHLADDDDFGMGEAAPANPAAAAAADEPEEDLAAPRGAVEAGDDWMEEEFGPTKAKKGKGGKKGGNKKQQQKQADSDDELADKVGEVTLEEAKEAKPPAKAAAAPPKEEKADVEEDDGEPQRMLTKKEKEKLKKEKEKAKKKAQAAAKKASEPAPTAAAEAPSAPAAAADDDAAEDDGDAGASSAKNKKKKKKKAGAAAADEPEPAPAAGKKGKGGGGQIAALRALMEAQKKAAEEQAAREEEERRKIEEEERRVAEEERLKEEARLAKKEKEKAKKEQLKREGKLLTPKQKAERAAAEARRQALLASGNVTIAGLAGDKAPAAGPAKVSYGKRERGGKKPVSPAPGTPEPEKVEEAPKPAPEPVKAKAEEPKAAEEEDEDVKDSWDASSSEDEKPAAKEEEDVKDSWDASSDEEGEKPAAKAPAKAANGKAAAKQPPAPQASVPAKGKAAPAAKPAAKGKAAPAPESSSEEEEDSDDDSDSDSDDDSDDDSDSDSDDDSSDDGMTATERQLAQRKAEAKERRLAKNAQALAERDKDNMRSPICVIMGHVDTGKTKLLDKIRQTNVQEGEAGGITQQIGATYFPMDAIQKKTRVLGADDLKEYKLPGLLVIDTPGHESFTNLRTRGSSLCNIAILVVDIMHGLEPQTLESLRLLREGKTPFIVALNKIDRLYGWNAVKDNGFQDSLSKQNKAVQREYENRLSQTIVAFAEQGLNAVPYYKNTNFAKNVSLVPTSAHTGEGVPDMLMLIIKLTQERMAERLMYISTLECTVLEVKVIEGLGTTIDVVLSNGVLYEGDKIVVCGLNGAITTQVRALLTPQPMKELRIKGQYVHHKSIKAAMGVKIVAPDLEKAIAGSRLLVCGEDDDEDDLREEVMSDLTNLLDSVDKSGRGVCVQASTLGSLEALLEFLRVSKIPVSGINIGPVHKKDVMRASTMLEKAKELAVILCFDVPVDKDAERMADELGIKIFKADIIYHLFDQFTAYHAQTVEEKKASAADKAVFPCRLKTIACFAKRDPIILGVDIIDGTLRIGTPLCVVKVDPATKKKEILKLGQITSLEVNHKAKDIVKKHEAGAGVAVKIERAPHEQAQQFGRHFDDKDEVISMISRESIDVLKNLFRDDVSKDEWLLIRALKPKLDIA